jgi:hypothetical protein
MVVAVVGEVVVAMVNIRLCSWNLAYGQHGTRDRGRNESRLCHELIPWAGLISPAAPATTFTALVRLAVKGSNKSARFRTALPCSLAFRDSIRFALVAANAGADVDAAIGRTRGQIKRNRKRDSCYQYA